MSDSSLKDKVIAHARKMKVPVDNTRSKCVDGGYRGDESVGAIAFAGAHLGLSMALLKLGFTPTDAFEHVYAFVTKDGNPYCWHTDTHEGHGAIVGCGHCNAAISSAEHYGVSGEAVSELLEIVREAQENRENMEMVILDREHAEEAILVITSTDYTVKPWDQEDDVQFFIYDKVRHLSLLEDFVTFLQANDVEISYDELVTASDEQTNATLGLLGSSKGKPLFTVNVTEEDEVEVQHVGTAPVIG